MSQKYRALVVLGRRGPAIPAALEAAASVVVVAPRLARRFREASRLHWLDADPEDMVLEDIVGALPPVAFDAVLAAGEGTVRPAAALRRRLELPGMSPLAAARCTDKALMKARIREHGVRCADWVTADENLGGASLIERLGLPMVVKDRVGSGGRGTRIVRRADEVPESLAPGRMVESFVSGREMSVEALVHDGEIVWSNVTEYVEPRSINLLPSAPRPPAVATALMEAVARSITALGVERGLTHTEVFVDDSGVVFGELAVRPPGGYIMRAVSLAYGFDPWRAWIDTECGRLPQTVTCARRVAAVKVLHPGAGIVIEASGVEAAAALSGVEDVSLRVQVGDRLAPRLGAGQEAGHVVAVGETGAEALARLSAATDRIQLRIDERTA